MTFKQQGVMIQSVIKKIRELHLSTIEFCDIVKRQGEKIKMRGEL